MSWQLAEQGVNRRRVSADLMADGYAVTAPILSGDDRDRPNSYCDDEQIEFRATINRARSVSRRRSSSC